MIKYCFLPKRVGGPRANNMLAASGLKGLPGKAIGKLTFGFLKILRNVLLLMRYMNSVMNRLDA